MHISAGTLFKRLTSSFALPSFNVMLILLCRTSHRNAHASAIETEQVQPAIIRNIPSGNKISVEGRASTEHSFQTRRTRNVPRRNIPVERLAFGEHEAQIRRIGNNPRGDTIPMKGAAFGEHAAQTCRPRNVRGYIITVEGLAFAKHGAKICSAGDIPRGNITVEVDASIEHGTEICCISNIPEGNIIVEVIAPVRYMPSGKAALNRSNAIFLFESNTCEKSVI
uniref:Uncharacterized protein n=1 Tax=Grammatophora oceanica TaxID=210454 RepID=A0A7S1UWL5_9STRA|mmetsp:Transcript_23564/g.34882  ORF Transcript_23564/g.34882 Transcript_23564/m.34882 type:complete len:224 (+) Transcript_23564:179-850(+)